MIRCEQLQKKYRGKQVLQNISFIIDEPKIVGLIGRNGVGKSTLMKILAGHGKPTSGEVTVFDQKPFNSLIVATNSIFIEESMSFPPTMSLQDILKSAKAFYPNFVTELALDLLDYASISRKDYHHNLSKGQKSTFHLIYALASRCAVTLLDEPMNGMDEAIRGDFYRAILKEYIAFPRLLIISSHHLHEIEHLIEEILLIDEGHVELHVPLEEIQQMALRLTGAKEQIEQFIDPASVLLEKQNGPFYEVIVEAKHFKQDESTLREAGIQANSVSAADLCKVLTNKSKGGIDNVFK